MSILDLFRPKAAPEPLAAPRASFEGEEWVGLDFSDPALGELLRYGLGNTALPASRGEIDKALLNTTVFRCVSLISCTIGSLPLYLRRRNLTTKVVTDATDHPLYELLLHEPNDYQSAFDFKAQMQANALTEGNGYAVIVWSRGRPIRLVPLDPWRVKPMQNADWTLTYRYHKPDGSYQDYPADEILHLKGFSRDGILGVSRVHMAKEAISLALQTEKAASRLFTHGLMVGGVLSHPKTLSQQAHDRLIESLNRRHAGAENAHKWLILEENMDVKSSPSSSTAQNSQMIELRRLQIEETCRVFDVPRPLAMVDETSWGTGIQQLGRFFVSYGLNPWFVSWEQALRRSALTKRERREGELFCDFDERELLRGSPVEQAEYYAKALGAGGQSAWMKPNEVRDDVGLSSDPDGNTLVNPMTAPAGGAAPPTGTSTGDSNGASR